MLALSIPRQTTIIIGAVFVALLLLEGLARGFHDWVNPRRSRVVPVEISRYDHRLGWSLIPGSYAVSSATDETVRYRINSLGLRGREVSVTPDPEIYRILFIGASRAFGFGVNEQQHVPHLLENYLDGVEVLNGGVSGYGLDQILLNYAQNGSKLNPDLVLLYLPHFSGHRHMHDVRFGERKPQFVLENSGLRLVNDLPERPPQPAPLWPTPLTGWIEERSVLAELIVHRLTKLINRLDDPFTPNLSYKKSRAQDEANKRDPRFMAKMHLVADKLIERLGAEVKSSGSEFLLVTEMKKFANAAEQHGIETLYLYHQMSNSSYALPYGLEHLNPAGNAVLAAKIFEAITANHWLCSRHHAHYRC